MANNREQAKTYIKQMLPAANTLTCSTITLGTITYQGGIIRKFIHVDDANDDDKGQDG